MSIPWLSIVLFLPLVVGLLILALPRDNMRLPGSVALVGSLLNLLVAVIINRALDPQAIGFQLEERVSWIPSIGSSYHLGVDGLSAGLVLLTAFLTPVVIGYLSPRLREDGRAQLFTILALETSLIGVLLSVDMLLFYVFWEAMLIPMYFLISVWGGERRAYASLKFIVYMMLGSLLMLAGILWFYWWHHTHNGAGAYSFDLVQWTAVNISFASRIPHSIQMWMFFFFFISFAIKLPLFPFHTWLPDAQQEGPVAFNLLLIEVGAYAFVRFCLPLFPDASLTWAPALMALAVINIIYGAILASVQTDLKRLFAYAQLSHAGFMLLGIFAMTIQGISGSVLFMINSGITGAALYIVADLLYRRRRSRLIDDYGGLAPKMPLLFFIFLFVALGAIGLPGLNGFVSEFLVLLGSIRSTVVSPAYGYAAGAGVVLSAVYMLWMFQRVMYGQRPAVLDDVVDLEGEEKWTLWPFVAVILAIGLGSAWLTRPMRPAASSVIASVQNGVAGTSQSGPAPDVAPGTAPDMAQMAAPGIAQESSPQ